MTLLGRAHPRVNSTGQCRVDTSQARPYTTWTLGQEDNNMQNQGTLKQRYEIYVEQAGSLGWEIKSFDEWLNS